MIYKNLNDCVKDLESRGQLIRIKEEINPNLEIAEIHRRVYEQKGPALLFEKIKGSPFKGLSNLFGTIERSEYIFQDVLKKFEFLIKLKIDPTFALRNPGKTLMNLPSMLSSIPRKAWNNSIVNQTCKISQLPQIKSWQDDGGAFVTLPQVISFPPGSKKLKDANVGMYRIQLSGNEYEMDKEVGLHYQLHRGIGIHHKMYNESDKEFKISIGIGGPPSNTLASIFPLPEGLSEIIFSGILGQRAYRYNWQNGYFIPSEADFVITGKINKSKLKPEGPFGDHLGYYSLTHDFPVMEVDKIFHRKDAIWHFTVVGRPPQEDSSFGHLIHELVKSLTTHELPGIKEVHAVDAAGVHPLLLAIGSERYMPFRERKPEEILTQANLLLGKGQTSLAKFLFIAADEENSSLNLKNIPEFIIYCLERADFTKD
ncbi:MAG: UbiD family decarboxylase, partial [Saprospiraceae bacterium]